MNGTSGAATNANHPFQDKLIVFIGSTKNVTRRAARDALFAVGGIPDERITAFTNYAVAFDHASETQAYQNAVKYAQQGLLTILTEEQFIDILGGKAEPPVALPRSDDIIVRQAKTTEANDCESEQMMRDILNRKRMNSLAKHGVPTQGGRIRVDLRPLDTIRRVSKLI